MNEIYGDLVRQFSTTTGSLGRNSIDADEAFRTLRQCIVTTFDLSHAQPVWHWGNIAADILAELIPKSATVFVVQGDRTGPNDTERFELEAAVAIIIRRVMLGIKFFETDDTRKIGASKMLEFCPNPIAPSQFPFADARGVWSHTHTKSDVTESK
jgi:hypothetical protein